LFLSNIMKYLKTKINEDYKSYKGSSCKTSRVPMSLLFCKCLHRKYKVNGKFYV
jgi:hypothetical protein